MSDPVFKTSENSIKMLADWKCGVKVMRGPSLFPGRRSSLIYALISSSIYYLWSSIIMLFGTDESMESQPSSSLQGSQPCRHFEFPEIQLATENFDESLVIGKGGFGKVYKGNVIYGSSLVVAAIKRLDSMSSQGADEFWAEVETLSMLRHCNLVSLIGYCNHGKEMILVYEYLPNGTLDDHLHKLGTSLSWIQRLKICIGSGQGLHYLHTGTGIDSGVIHRDVKSSNILLHESWAAKISDFGLSRIGPTNQPSTYVNTHVKGTFGYLDPNYFATGRLTRKSDVYAFGVVLMEVLCRKRAVDRSLDWGLATWAQDSIKEGDLKNIIDSGIKGEISPKCLKEFVGIAERCLHSHPKQRPTMAEVVVSLESILTLQEKINSSSQAAGKTIFGRMLMFPFTSLAENSAHGDSKLSSNNKGNSKTVRNTAGADNKTFLGKKEHPADNRIQSLKEFKFSDLKKATRNFSPDLLLGEGGFGKVFLGWVDQNTFAPSKRGVGIAVAVKRLSQDSFQGKLEWQTEVSFLGRLANPNIISLLGYCSFELEELLVYEYMQNKSFDRFLFTNAPHNAKPLSWETRHKILIGVARGLNYLHSSKVQVIFRNLKCADILLDEDFNAKLGDFGLAKSAPDIGETHVSTRVMGTYGYADPAYMSTVVLLETLTGLTVLDRNRLAEKHNLVDWACPFLGRREKLKKIMDPRLEQNYPLEGALECTKLALRCLAIQPKDRPSSEEVLQSLEQLYAADK